MEVAIAMLDAVPRLAGEYALDAEQSDVSAGRGGLRRGMPLRARGVGESHRGGADCGDDCAGCARRAHRAEEKNGHAGGRATGHSGRPHDRKRVLHVFCSGRDGVALASGFVFCARGSHGFLARAGDEGGAFRLGCECHAADAVGPGSGHFALEPRPVCGDEMPVLLLSGIGTGADTRTGGAGGRTGGGCARHDARGGAGADVDDGGVLPGAGAAGFGGRMEIRFGKRGAGARSEERGPGGDVKPRKEVEEVKEKKGGVAVFFDLDGTVVALPSLEMRLFRTLRYRRAIRTKNYFLWLREALRLIPRGISAILQANKMVLRGVQTFDERGEGDGDVFSRHKDGHQAEGQASAPPRRYPRLPVPAFFQQAIKRVVWHGKQGHEIVLISGTLEPLARAAARAMEAELGARGIMTTIRVCATRLEEMDGRWTGRVLGEAMFGEAKARAAKRLAGEMRLDLGRCYAYGDSFTDRWLLAAVGRPAAVNPSKDLVNIARARGWPVLNWKEKESLTQRHRGRSAQRHCRMELVRPENPE